MKRIFVFIMAFIVFSTNAYSENEMVVSEEEAASLYEWEVVDDLVTILDYHGPSVVVLPAKIGKHKVTRIEGFAFFMKDITSISLPNTITSIGQSAFTWNNINEVIIPDSVRSIGDAAFANNRIHKIILGKNIANINESVFRQNYCTEISIPENVKTIREAAFIQMDSIKGSLNDPIPWVLRSIKIGESVTIEAYALPDDFLETYNACGKGAGEYLLNNDGTWQLKKEEK